MSDAVIEKERDTYELDGKIVKPEMLKSDLTEEMKIQAFDLAIEGMNRYSVERDIADYVKQKFDEVFEPSWQCIIGIRSTLI